MDEPTTKRPTPAPAIELLRAQRARDRPVCFWEAQPRDADAGAARGGLGRTAVADRRLRKLGTKRLQLGHRHCEAWGVVPTMADEPFDPFPGPGPCCAGADCRSARSAH